MPEVEVQTDHQFEVKSVDAERGIVYGYAYVSVKADGTQVYDHSKEFIPPNDLESWAYDFVLESREGDEFHTPDVKAAMVESVVITPDKAKLLGIADGDVGVRWWVGFKITDAELLEKAKNGDYPMLSIGGHWMRETVDVDG